MAEPEVQAFLNHLGAERDVAASTQTLALSALLFLYDVVLNQPLDTLNGLVRVRKPPRLPTVLSRDEVHALLGHATLATPPADLHVAPLMGLGIRSPLDRLTDWAPSTELATTPS